MREPGLSIGNWIVQVYDSLPFGRTLCFMMAIRLFAEGPKPQIVDGPVSSSVVAVVELGKGEWEV